MINLVILISIIFTYILIHIMIHEFSLYYPNILRKIGLFLSLISDIVFLYSPMIGLGIYLIVVAICLNCFETWLKYLILIKLGYLVCPLFLLVPTVLIYVIIYLAERCLE